jgi:hypothetical protein
MIQEGGQARVPCPPPARRHCSGVVSSADPASLPTKVRLTCRPRSDTARVAGRAHWTREHIRVLFNQLHVTTSACIPLPPAGHEQWVGYGSTSVGRSSFAGDWSALAMRADTIGCRPLARSGQRQSWGKASAKDVVPTPVLACQLPNRRPAARGSPMPGYSADHHGPTEPQPGGDGSCADSG